MRGWIEMEVVVLQGVWMRMLDVCWKGKQERYAAVVLWVWRVWINGRGNWNKVWRLFSDSNHHRLWMSVV